MTISEQDLRGLSAAEREALLATDSDDEDLQHELGTTNDDDDADEAPRQPARQKVEGDEADVNDDNDGDDGEPAAAPAPAPAPAAPAPAPADAPAQDDADADEEDEPIEPQRSAPADAAEQRKTLRAEKSAALRQLVDGEITQEAYDEIENRTQDALDSLSQAEAADKAREQVRMDMMMGDYQRELKTAQKELRTAGLDLAANDGKLRAELDRAIKMFAGEATERGLTDRPGDLAASRDALAEATAYVLRRHGKAAPAPAAAAPASAPAQAAKPARSVEPPDRSKFAPTLATVPVAADATVSNEFAHIEGLEGAALERALARMTPEQQDRYLA
jgi:hypothetical protein